MHGQRNIKIRKGCYTNCAISQPTPSPRQSSQSHKGTNRKKKAFKNVRYTACLSGVCTPSSFSRETQVKKADNISCVLPTTKLQHYLYYHTHNATSPHSYVVMDAMFKYPIFHSNSLNVFTVVTYVLTHIVSNMNTV
jgi:hypothetical protein